MLQREYKNAEAILATPETCTLDAMEEFCTQVMNTIEIIETLLETGENDFSQLKRTFSHIFLRIAMNTP